MARNSESRLGRLMGRARRHSRRELFTLARNGVLGMAGVSVAAILTALRLPNRDTLLDIAVGSLAAGIPLLVANALIFETFIWLGKSSYGFQWSDEYTNSAGASLFFGSAFSICGIGLLLYRYSVEAAGVFAVSASVGIAVVLYTHWSLEGYLEDRESKTGESHFEDESSGN